MSAPTFFTAAWAAAVRDALQRGPDAATRARALPEYWDFFDLVRSRYTATWALGVRDLPAQLGGAPSYLTVEWKDGDVVDARVSGPDEPLAATYTLAGDYADWRALLGGYDARRAVMYRKILLEEGDLLAFFQTIYFFVECLAVLAQVPASIP